MAGLSSDDACVSFLHPRVGATSVALSPSAPFVLGRSGANADLALDWDPRVSRRHARLVAKPDGVWFEDLGSRNGSWMGDLRITTPVRMLPGIEIIVGETVVSLDDRRTRKRPLPVLSLGAGFDSTTDLRADPQGGKLLSDTMDMPLIEDVSPPVPVIRKLRAAPAFLSETQVQVKVTGPEELAELWDRELSRGVLFVPTQETRAAGTVIDIQVVSPHGSVRLEGRIEWRIGSATSAKTKRPMGLGMAVHLGTAERRAIREYAEGLVARLSQSDAGQAATSEEREHIAGALLELAEEDDLYGALGLAPIAPMLEIKARIASLRILFDDEPAPGIPSARAALDRIESVLGNESERLAYDLRFGHVRAEERIALAKNGLGPTLTTLRMAWEKAWPSHADRAAALSRLAFQQHAKGKHAEAIDAAKAALELHPFFDELRITMRAWMKEKRAPSPTRAAS